MPGAAASGVAQKALTSLMAEVEVGSLSQRLAQMLGKRRMMSLRPLWDVVLGSGALEEGSKRCEQSLPADREASN